MGSGDERQQQEPSRRRLSTGLTPGCNEWYLTRTWIWNWFNSCNSSAAQIALSIARIEALEFIFDALTVTTEYRQQRCQWPITCMMSI